MSRTGNIFRRRKYIAQVFLTLVESRTRSVGSSENLLLASNNKAFKIVLRSCRHIHCTDTHNLVSLIAKYLKPRRNGSRGALFVTLAAALKDGVYCSERVLYQSRTALSIQDVEV